MDIDRTILQIIPAPPGMVAKFDGGKHTTPVICLALVQYRTARSMGQRVEAMLLAEKQLQFAFDYGGFDGLLMNLP